MVAVGLHDVVAVMFEGHDFVMIVADDCCISNLAFCIPIAFLLTFSLSVVIILQADHCLNRLVGISSCGGEFEKGSVPLSSS